MAHDEKRPVMDADRITAVIADMRAMGILADSLEFSRLQAVHGLLAGIKRDYTTVIELFAECDMRSSLTGRNLQAALATNMERFGFLFGMIDIMQWIAEEYGEKGDGKVSD